MASQIQSLMFEKDKFSKKAAVRWARDHGFAARKVDEQANYWRLRQKDPRRFKDFRTVRMDTPGVLAVLGFSRKLNPEAATQAKRAYNRFHNRSIRAFRSGKLETPGLTEQKLRDYLAETKPEWITYFEKEYATQGPGSRKVNGLPVVAMAELMFGGIAVSSALEKLAGYVRRG